MTEPERHQGSAADYRIHVEPSPKRVKVVFNDVTVADSGQALVLHETRLPPVYYLPREDVRLDLMKRTDYRTHCPFKGNASYWTLDVADQRAENAVWSYEDPFDQTAGLKDYVAFYEDRVEWD